uniref:Uncharacterized protein n=1 Tax=Arundo donax TaxID=35708 RepID=A0A0A9GNW0_ARUDO
MGPPPRARWTRARRRPPALQLRPRRCLPPLFGEGHDGVDGVDREGALLRLCAEERQRRAPFFRFNACAGRMLTKVTNRIEVQYDGTNREHQVLGATTGCISLFFLAVGLLFWWKHRRNQQILFSVDDTNTLRTSTLEA